MSKKKELEPKLRFREFEDCDVWNSYKLGNITQILTGGTPSTKVEDYWYPKEIPWMASGEINKKRLFKTDNLISYNGFENSSATWIKEKSVLIALAGQGKTRGTVAINEIPLTTNQSIAAILPFKDKLYPEFLYQNLDNRYEELRLVSSGDGTRGGLNKDIISELQVKAPNILEQKMIGNFFKKIDKMIQLQQSKVNKVKDIKSAYLSEMFPKEGEKYPKKRFEGFIEPWYKNKFNEITEYITSSLSANNTLIKGRYELYDANELIGYTNSSGQKQEYITIIKDGSGVGRVRLLPKDTNFIGTMGAIVNNDQTDIHYIYAYLQQFNFNEFITGATVPHVYYRDYGESTAYHPSYEEQVKIGKLFKNLDNQISIEEEKLSKLEKLKQAYLNDMFV